MNACCNANLCLPPFLKWAAIVQMPLPAADSKEHYFPSTNVYCCNTTLWAKWPILGQPEPSSMHRTYHLNSQPDGHLSTVATPHPHPTQAGRSDPRNLPFMEGFMKVNTLSLTGKLLSTATKRWELKTGCRMYFAGCVNTCECYALHNLHRDTYLAVIFVPRNVSLNSTLKVVSCLEWVSKWKSSTDYIIWSTKRCLYSLETFLNLEKNTQQKICRFISGFEIMLQSELFPLHSSQKGLYNP